MSENEEYTVLIVEDSVTMQQYFYNLLSKNGFIVKGLAENGLDGVEKYAMLEPDLVIMDENMPTMSGLHAIQRIMEHDFDAESILVTGFSGVDSAKAFSAGASAFFNKPIEDKETFINVCKELAKKRADQRKK